MGRRQRRSNFHSHLPPGTARPQSGKLPSTHSFSSSTVAATTSSISSTASSSVSSGLSTTVMQQTATVSASAKTRTMRNKMQSPQDMEGRIVADCFVPQKDRFYNEQEPLLLIQPNRILADSEKQTFELRQYFASSIPLLPHALVRAKAETLNQTLQYALQQQQEYHAGMVLHLRQQLLSYPMMMMPPQELFLQQGRPVAGMPLRSLAPDTHFSVKYRQQMRLTPSQQQTPAAPSQTLLASSPLMDQDRDKPLPSLQILWESHTEKEASNQHIENTNNSRNSNNRFDNDLIAKYCDILEEHLFAERRENLLLFERYSQHHYDKIMVQQGVDGDESNCTCWIELEGIADAQPAVQVGDIVLLRPCEMVRKKPPVPIPTPAHYNPYYHPDPQNPYAAHPYVHHPNPMMQHQGQSTPLAAVSAGPTYGVVEVQTQVIAVTRSNLHQKIDRVHVTWPEDAKLQHIATEYHLPASLITPKYSPPSHNIRIVPNPRPLVRFLTAVDWLRSCLHSTSHGNSSSLFQELFFPTKAPILPPVRDDDVLLPESKDRYELNTQQHSFVRLMLQRTLYPSTDHIRGPLILTGPAGTGKTRTMLAGIQRILALNSTDNISNGLMSKRRVRILVCTPSHTAANVIAEGLGRFLKPSQLFRLLDASRPVTTIPLSLSPFYRQDHITGAFCLPPPQELLKFDVIVSTCLDAHLLYSAGCTNQQLRLHRTSICQHAEQQLRACGASLGHSTGTNAVSSQTPIETVPHFSHLLLDEAAQAIEAESLVPLSVVADPAPGVPKVEVVLVGDPRQLSPQVFSEKAVEAGFGCSWMERLLRQPVECTGGGNDTLLGEDQSQLESLLRFSLQSQTLLSVFLTMNYRGHPAFLCMPSALFYSDLLQSAPPRPKPTHNENGVRLLDSLEWLDKLRIVECLSTPVFLQDDDGGDSVLEEELLVPQKQFGFPIHFRGVIGKDVVATVHMGFTGNSWMNQKEAETVVEIIKTLVSDEQPNGTPPVDPSLIGVCSPFRGQVDLIRKLLRAEGLASVDVGTIEDYQAKEWDVIILSLTRSTQSLVPSDVARRMGVFGQPKRSNVALTRAENLFIVVGNPNTCMADHYVWRQFLLFCYRNGLWYGKRNDNDVPSKPIVANNLEELIQRHRVGDENYEENGETEARAPRNSASNQSPPHTNHNGVIVSRYERLLRGSNIV